MTIWWEHQVGWNGVVGNEVVLRTEVTYQDSNYQWTAGQSETQALVDAWDEEWDVGYDTTEHDAQEDRNQVRVVEALHLVTQHLLCMTDGKLGAHYGDTVAQLQFQVWCGNQIDTGTVYTGDVGADRLTAVGYGDERPIADNNTSAGRAQNRRVEFDLTYLEKVEEVVLDHADPVVEPTTSENNSENK